MTAAQGGQSAENDAAEQTCLAANCDPCTPACLALHARLTRVIPPAVSDT